MKRFASKPAQSNIQQQAPSVISPEALQTFDLTTLLSKSGTILAREIQNLLIASSGGKLDAANARDLVQYVKLLSELKTEQSKELSNMAPEELEALQHD